MAGIYIHIPFCTQACHYCDFHFSTNLENKSVLVSAISRELEMQKTYLEEESVQTVYFGGGTPSLLQPEELESLLRTVQENFKMADDPELTLEANPENLSEETLLFYKSVGINRLSLGIQSFNDAHLVFLNRAHSSNEAKQAIESVSKVGFNLVNIDLIFGIKPNDDRIWESDLDTAISFKPEHLSVYNLTVEQGTVFGHWKKRKKLSWPDEDQCQRQFIMAHQKLTASGYDHYEISNYALPGMHSKHNSAYWKNQKYLGVGPGAHSFNLDTRQFNIRNNALYVKGIHCGQIPASMENLNKTDKINELILTGLRTKWGVKISLFDQTEKNDVIIQKKAKIDDFMVRGLLTQENNVLKLTLDGQLLADSIIAELMI